MQCYFVPRQGCFAGALASAWVYLYHAAFRGNESIENEESEIRMSLIHQDLSTCASRLATREAELSGRIRTLTAEAAHRKSIMDINGAKKRLVERKRAQLQLEKITSSMSVIDMHMSTIEGTELNRSILETLRASGDALRRLGAKGGVEEVERVVNEVENQVESAAEISRIIAAANVTGSIGGMGHDVFSEEELEVHACHPEPHSQSQSPLTLVLHPVARQSSTSFWTWTPQRPPTRWRSPRINNTLRRAASSPTGFHRSPCRLDHPLHPGPRRRRRRPCTGECRPCPPRSYPHTPSPFSTSRTLLALRRESWAHRHLILLLHPPRARGVAAGEWPHGIQECISSSSSSRLSRPAPCKGVTQCPLKFE